MKIRVDCATCLEANTKLTEEICKTCFENGTKENPYPNWKDANNQEGE